MVSDMRLRDLETHVGRDRLVRLIDLFRTDLDRAVAAVISANDPAATARAAHGIISLVGALGCGELLARARELAIASESAAGDVGRLRVAIAQASVRVLAALDGRYPGARRSAVLVDGARLAERRDHLPT